MWIEVKYTLRINMMFWFDGLNKSIRYKTCEKSDMLNTNHNLVSFAKKLSSDISWRLKFFLPIQFPTQLLIPCQFE